MPELSAAQRHDLLTHMADLPDFQGVLAQQVTLSLAGLGRYARRLPIGEDAEKFCTQLIAVLAGTGELPALLTLLISRLGNSPARRAFEAALTLLGGPQTAPGGPCRVDLPAEIEAEIGLLPADRALLAQLDALRRLEVVKRFDEGQSTSVVLLVDVSFRREEDRPYSGYAFLKIDQADRVEAEYQKHHAALIAIGGGAVPQPLSRVTAADGSRSAALYAAAGGAVEKAQSISRLLKRDFPPALAAEVLDRFCQTVIGVWNPPDQVADDRQRKSPRDWLLHTLDCGSLTPGNRLREVLALDVPCGATHPYLSVPELFELLPNPLAYANTPTLWHYQDRIAAPMGNAHGDLHTSNLIYPAETERGTPWLIDFARYTPDSVAFFDLAYLELDIFIARFRQRDWSEWGVLMKAVTANILLDARLTPRSDAAFVAWTIVKPLREHVQRLIAAAGENLRVGFTAAWWLTAAGVGLIFARRESYKDKPERLMSFSYAAYCLRQALSVLNVAPQSADELFTFNLAARPAAPNMAAIRQAEIAYAKTLQGYFVKLDDMYVDLAGQTGEGFGEVAAPLTTATRSDAPLTVWDEEDRVLRRERNNTRPHLESGQAGQPRQQVESVRAALRAEDRIVLLGEPGAGKTWTLRRLALQYAADLAESPEAAIPIYVPLAEYTGNSAADFESFVREQVRKHSPALADSLSLSTVKDRLIYLCDALNEMPHGDGGRTLASVQAALRPIKRVAVSCRERDFKSGEDGDLKGAGHFSVIYIRPLTPRQIKQIIDHFLYRDKESGQWVALTADQQGRLWETELQGNALLLAAWDEMTAAGHEDAFWREADPPEPLLRESGKWGWGDYPYDRRDELRRIMLRHPKGLMLLCRNPYLLYVVLEIFRTPEGLPPARGDLFGRFANWLIDREKHYAERRHMAWPAGQAETLFRALTALGEELQLTRGGQTSAPFAEAVRHLGGEGFLTLGVQCSILQVTGENVRFTHQLLQEYFASYAMARDMVDGVPASKYWPPDKWWETTKADQTARLLAGVQAAASNLIQFTRWLAPHQPELALDAAIEAVGATWQTAATALSAEGEHAETRQVLLESANKLGALPPPSPLGEGGRGGEVQRRKVEVLARAAAWRVIGLLKADPRPGVLDFDIQWCDVPGGPFQMGGNGQFDGKPIHTVEVAPFQIAKYPVTYWQFQAFIDAPDGFNNPDWWHGLHEDGLKQQRGGPGDQRFKVWNHPRENVSWYEAVAFCRWLTARLALTPLPPLPQGERGSREADESAVRLEISPQLREKMNEIARRLRREQTGTETRLWTALRNSQLDGRRFRRQQPIGPFVLDFYCASERLAVEVDGAIHERQREADATRQALIESLGIRFVRVTATEVETALPTVLAVIRAAFANQLPSPLTSQLPSPFTNFADQLPSPLVGEGRGGEGWGGEGLIIRLPTEAEWEKAARWNGQRSLEYPYGDTFDAAKGNTSETGIGQTSAVGIFPDGAAPCGALDMSGNVWEWVSSKYEGGYPYRADDGREDLAGNATRRVRGGSWFDSRNGARAAARGDSNPNDRSRNLGFRVVVGPRPPSV